MNTELEKLIHEHIVKSGKDPEYLSRIKEQMVYEDSKTKQYKVTRRSTADKIIKILEDECCDIDRRNKTLECVVEEACAGANFDTVKTLEELIAVYVRNRVKRTISMEQKHGNGESYRTWQRTP